jgi:hypothetical protein
MEFLCNLFGLPEEVLRKLVVLIHNGELTPVSDPHTTNPEILKRVNFVNDYYNYLVNNYN